MEPRIKSRLDSKNSYSYPLYQNPPQKPGLLFKKDLSISAFFLYLFPVLTRVFMKHFSLVKMKIDAEKINPNMQNKRTVSA